MSNYSEEELVHIALSIMHHININVEEGDLDDVEWINTAMSKYSLALIVRFVEVRKRDEVWDVAKTMPPLYTNLIPEIKEKVEDQQLFIVKTCPDELIEVMPATSTTKNKKSKKSKKAARRSAKKLAKQAARNVVKAGNQSTSPD